MTDFRPPRPLAVCFPLAGTHGLSGHCRFDYPEQPTRRRLTHSRLTPQPIRLLAALGYKPRTSTSTPPSLESNEVCCRVCGCNTTTKIDLPTGLGLLPRPFDLDALRHSFQSLFPPDCGELNLRVETVFLPRFIPPQQNQCSAKHRDGACIDGPLSRRD